MSASLNSASNSSLGSFSAAAQQAAVPSTSSASAGAAASASAAVASHAPQWFSGINATQMLSKAQVADISGFRFAPTRVDPSLSRYEREEQEELEERENIPSDQCAANYNMGMVWRACMDHVMKMNLNPVLLPDLVQLCSEYAQQKVFFQYTQGGNPWNIPIGWSNRPVPTMPTQLVPAPMDLYPVFPLELQMHATVIPKAEPRLRLTPRWGIEETLSETPKIRAKNSKDFGPRAFLRYDILRINAFVDMDWENPPPRIRPNNLVVWRIGGPQHVRTGSLVSRRILFNYRPRVRGSEDNISRDLLKRICGPQENSSFSGAAQVAQRQLSPQAFSLVGMHPLTVTNPSDPGSVVIGKDTRAAEWTANPFPPHHVLNEVERILGLSHTHFTTTMTEFVQHGTDEQLVWKIVDIYEKQLHRKEAIIIEPQTN